MSIPSNKYDIEIECGADFALSFVIRDDGGSLVNLADAVITAQLREYAEAQDYLEFTAVHNSAGGKITLTMAHEDTANISYTEGVYDVFVTLDGTTEKVVYGDVTVYPNVTKPVEGEIMYLLSFNTEEDLPAVGMMRRVYFCHASSFMYRWNGTAYVGMNMNTYWDDIPDKPETFPPSEHDHDDRYYTEGEVDTALAGKEDIANLKALAYKDKADFYDDIANLPSGYPPSPHNHDDRYYTEGETDTLLSGKSDTDHTHDDRYYTEGEVDTLLSAKADTDDLGALATKDTVDYDTDIDNLPTLGALAEKDAVDWDTDIDDIPEDFPPSAHTHTMSDVTDLPTFGDLAEKDTVDWDTDIDDIPSTFPPESHTHDDRYYTETEIDTALSGKSDTSHTHDDRYYTETDTDSLLSEKADIIHTSASGSFVHLTDAGAYPVDSLSVGIEPVQDLHGYDAPWPAGGGKNLMRTFVDGTHTVGTITVTISNGKITINGSSTSDGYYEEAVTETSLPDTVYIQMNNATTSYSFNVVFIYNGTQIGAYSGNVINRITDASSALGGKKYNKIRVYWTTNSSFSNYEFTPMLTSDSTPLTTWQPYSNICPISGHSSAVVTRTGKNLVDITKSESGGIDSSGVEIVSADNWRCNEFIPIASNTVYTLSSTAPITRLYFFDANYTFISPRQQASYDKVTATSPANAKYAKWTIYIPNTTVTYADAVASKIQLELGSTATTWTSYQPIQQVTIDLDGTRYGGTLNVLTGEMTVDRAIWTNNTSTMNNSENYPGWMNSGIKDIYGSGKNGRLGEGVCFSNISGVVGPSGENKDYFAVNTTGNNDVLYLPKTAWGGKTQAEWIADAIDVQIIVPLATPLTVTLDATTLSLLLGENNLWADTGSVAVGYRADTKLYIDSKLSAAVAELQALILDN